MSLAAYAAERAMVFDLVAKAQEKLFAVPGLPLLLVVLVPLLVGVVLGVQFQKCGAEARRVRNLQELLVFLPRSGQKMAVFTSAYGDCFHHTLASKASSQNTRTVHTFSTHSSLLVSCLEPNDSSRGAS